MFPGVTFKSGISVPLLAFIAISLSINFYFYYIVGVRRTKA